jgi:hypothetical protein
MSGLHRSEQALISRGRKAGLNTRDLYSALSTRPPELDARRPGEADGNGYVARLGPQGRRVYEPATDERG